MKNEYRNIYTEIVKKIFTKQRISIEEIDKLLEFAFSEGYNQCWIDEMKVKELMEKFENEREIDE